MCSPSLVSRIHWQRPVHDFRSAQLNTDRMLSERLAVDLAAHRIGPTAPPPNMPLPAAFVAVDPVWLPELVREVDKQCSRRFTMIRGA